MSKLLFDKTSYTYDDILLLPQYSTLRSRKDADTSYRFWHHERSNPIISANMETVTGPKMAKKLWSLGSIGALHRFQNINKNVQDYKDVISNNCECLVSIGVNGDAKDRAKALYDAGANMFIIDIAHGHSVLMREMLKWLREQYKDKIFIVAGNIATADAAYDLVDWGADAVKVGIGSGSLCTTRIITGHGRPSITAILDCYEELKQKNILIIADGGIKSAGDIVKSLAFGADCVMIGSLFAGTEETPGDIIGDGSGGMKKLYRGSSSYDRGPDVAKEGIEFEVPYKGNVEFIINELVGGLRSGMSYSNARTINELRNNILYTIQTPNGTYEGMPHIRFRKG